MKSLKVLGVIGFFITIFPRLNYAGNAGNNSNCRFYENNFLSKEFRCRVMVYDKNKPSSVGFIDGPDYRYMVKRGTSDFSRYSMGWRYIGRTCIEHETHNPTKKICWN